MITNIKKKQLKDVIKGNHDLYNNFSLVGDKLRVIYTALGWTHMTKDFSKADDVVEELTNYVLKDLLEKEEARIATAGLEVRGYFDEEELLNLEYSFNLI